MSTVLKQTGCLQQAIFYFNPLQILRNKICRQIEVFTYVKPITNEAYRV
jgi:hypothetical protein